MPQDAKYAAEQANLNMKAMVDTVTLKFTGEIGQVKGNKVVPIEKNDGTEMVPEDRVLRLSFLGIKYDFKPGDEQIVPRMAAKHWMRDNLLHWENKVVFEMREKENEAQMKARLLAELKAQARQEVQEENEQEQEDQEEASGTEEAPKRKPGRPKKS